MTLDATTQTGIAASASPQRRGPHPSIPNDGHPRARRRLGRFDHPRPRRQRLRVVRPRRSPPTATRSREHAHRDQCRRHGPGREPERDARVRATTTRSAVRPGRPGGTSSRATPRPDCRSPARTTIVQGNYDRAHRGRVRGAREHASRRRGPQRRREQDRGRRPLRQRAERHLGRPGADLAERLRQHPRHRELARHRRHRNGYLAGAGAGRSRHLHQRRCQQPDRPGHAGT